MKSITKILIGLIALSIVAGASIVMSNTVPVQTSEQIKVTDSIDQPTVIESSAPEQDNGAQIGYKGHVTIYKTEALTGKTTIVADKDNLLTTLGKKLIIAKLTNSDTNVSNVTRAVSLSADSGAGIAVGDTQLTSELTANGLARNATPTVTLNGTTGYNVSAHWTATASQNAASTGLQYHNGSATNGNLFAALAFTQQSLLINDQLQIVWQITIS
jgi:hypothetical protein